MTMIIYFEQSLTNLKLNKYFWIPKGNLRCKRRSKLSLLDYSDLGKKRNMIKKSTPHLQIISCMQSSWAISVKVDLNMEGLES